MAEMRRLTIRDRIDNAAYTLVHAIKTRIDNRGCDPFAVMGFAHVCKYCCSGWTMDDMPCGGCGCCYGQMYPKMTLWDEVVHYYIKPALHAVFRRPFQKPEVFDDESPF